MFLSKHISFIFRFHFHYISLIFPYIKFPFHVSCFCLRNVRYSFLSPITLRIKGIVQSSSMLKSEQYLIKSDHHEMFTSSSTELRWIILFSNQSNDSEPYQLLCHWWIWITVHWSPLQQSFNYARHGFPIRTSEKLIFDIFFLRMKYLNGYFSTVDTDYLFAQHMDLQEVGRGGMHWIELAQDRNR